MDKEKVKKSLDSARALGMMINMEPDLESHIKEKLDQIKKLLDEALEEIDQARA